MRARWMWVVLLGAGVAACGGEETRTHGGAAATLPDAFYGTWELGGTSGGLDGEGHPEPEGARPRMVLARDGTITHHAADGAVSARRFLARRGRTIFSTEDLWTITFEEGQPELVVQLGPDDTLTLSENVYDGFNSHYRRVPER